MEKQPLLSPDSRGDYRVDVTMPNYKTTVGDVISTLHTDVKSGLSDEEVEVRRKTHGWNVVDQAPPISVLGMLFRQFSDFMVILLIVAGIASLAMKDWIEAAALFAVVLANVSIGFVQQYKAETALRKLTSLSVPKCTVVRSSERIIVESSELVPGDVVVLEEGNQVPADLRLVEAMNLQINEALLTGESVPVQKQTQEISTDESIPLGDQLCLAFMSTEVIKGRGIGIVIATGRQTEMGKISQVVTKRKNFETMLQKRLHKVAKVLVILSIVLCALVVGMGFFRIRFASKRSITKEDIELWVKIGISLAVSVIPEGLVAVTTVTMALGVQRMAKRNALVRKLPSVETIGAMTTICTDKTGTLTLGKMKVERLWLASEHEIYITGASTQPSGCFMLDDKEMKTTDFQANLIRALTVCSLCNNASVQPQPDSEELACVGDPSEIALEIAAQKAGLGKATWMEEHSMVFLSEIPFDSEKKLMAVVYRSDGSPLALVKGAPESILSRCSSVMQADGQVGELSSDFRNRVEEKTMEMSASGLRVLALALHDLTDEEVRGLSQDVSAAETNLTFIGLIGLHDPPREEVKAAIQRCHEAGVKICMITGDHHATAEAIGAELGIIKRGDRHKVMTGSELVRCSVEELAKMETFPLIFSRVNPQDKKKIVHALRKRGEICSMIGDGVNDAPAIKHADVGISMGKSGTDVSKNVADIILMDDNFSTIVPALEEGRRTYDNIHKFVLYLLSCNSAEIYVMFIGVSIGLPPPFTPVMILWANLVCDIPPALALGVDPPEKDILHRPPRDPKAGIFSKETVVIVLIHGFSMAGLTLGIFCLHLYGFKEAVPSDPREPSHTRGVAFIALAMMQLVHAFLARSLSHTVFSLSVCSNKWLLAGFSLSLISLLAACYIPPLQWILGQWPLGLVDWGLVLACVLIHVLVCEMVKVLRRKVTSKHTDAY